LPFAAKESRDRISGARLRTRHGGVVDRKILLPVLRHPAGGVDDVAGDDEEIRLGAVDLIDDPALLRCVGAGIARDHEAIRLVGRGARLAFRGEHHAAVF